MRKDQQNINNTSLSRRLHVMRSNCPTVSSRKPQRLRPRIPYFALLEALLLPAARPAAHGPGERGRPTFNVRALSRSRAPQCRNCVAATRSERETPVPRVLDEDQYPARPACYAVEWIRALQPLRRVMGRRVRRAT